MTAPVGRVIVEADGGSRGNPGNAGYGAVVLDAVTGEVLAERSGSVGVATNNVAEYSGLIAGLTAAAELGAREVAVRMDSKLVVEQMEGRWQIKNEAMRALARQARDLRLRFDTVSFRWIPRAQNTRADRLANEAMDRAEGKVTRPARTATAAGTAAGAASSGAGWAPPTGPPSRLVLVRHGSTVHSGERRFSGRNDLPLDEPGEQQAAALARAAASWGPVAALVTSPIRRAARTAEVIGAALGLTPQPDDDFAELDFGAWEGLTFAEARERHGEDLLTWRGSATGDAAPTGGESFTALTRRVRRARNAVVAAHPGVTTVVVTHVTPIKTLVRLSLEAPVAALFALHLDVASVTVIDYATDGSSSVRSVNDTAHLR